MYINMLGFCFFIVGRWVMFVLYCFLGFLFGILGLDFVWYCFFFVGEGKGYLVFLVLFLQFFCKRGSKYKYCKGKGVLDFGLCMFCGYDMVLVQFYMMVGSFGIVVMDYYLLVFRFLCFLWVCVFLGVWVVFVCDVFFFLLFCRK